MKDKLTSVLKVLTLAERLKFELRHSYTSSGRQESVAEHTWRMSLMAVLVEPLLKQKVDTARLLKMIILHDLVEAEATDISALDVLRNPEIRLDKIEKEKKHLKLLFYDKLKVVNHIAQTTDCKSLYIKLKGADRSLVMYDILDADIKR